MAEHDNLTLSAQWHDRQPLHSYKPIVYAGKQSRYALNACLYLSHCKQDMKKIFIFAALAGAFYFVACTSTETRKSTTTVTEKAKPAIDNNALIGKWHMVNSVPKTPDPQMPQALITKSVIEDSDYWEFKPDNTTTSNSESLHQRKGKYSLQGDHLEINMTNVPSEDYTILKVDDKQLLLLTGVMADTWYFEKAK
jgi:hypothetical protein